MDGHICYKAKKKVPKAVFGTALAGSGSLQKNYGHMERKEPEEPNMGASAAPSLIGVGHHCFNECAVESTRVLPTPIPERTHSGASLCQTHHFCLCLLPFAHY
jgi:hypothetical protein